MQLFSVDIITNIANSACLKMSLLITVCLILACSLSERQGFSVRGDVYCVGTGTSGLCAVIYGQWSGTENFPHQTEVTSTLQHGNSQWYSFVLVPS